MEYDGYKEGNFYVLLLSGDYVVVKVEKVGSEKSFDGGVLYYVHFKHGSHTYINTYSRFMSQTYGKKVAEIHNTKYMDANLVFSQLPEDL